MVIGEIINATVFKAIFCKPLDIKWGYMIPPLAKMMDQSKDKKFHGSVKAVKVAIEGLEQLYKAVYKINPADAQYAVARFHFRPAISKFNFREAFHLLKLRTGNNAHPYVRRLILGLSRCTKQRSFKHNLPC